METKRKKHHRVYRRVPETMKLEIAKDYYLGQMPQVEIVRKYELCETTVREILRKFAAENNKSALLMKNKTTDSLSEENKALRKEVMELKKKLYDETMRADFYDTMIDVAEEMFGIEIRKKADTGQSKGCTKTK